MPGLSTLEKGLMLGIPATIAGIAAAPDESEGASVGKSALDWAAKNWRKLNPEKTIRPFQMEEASKWIGDLPKKMGLKLSQAAENSDRAILLEALQHPDFPNLQASHINTLRAETAALPDAIHEAVKPEFKFLPSGTNPKLGGQFSYNPKTEKSIVKFNPSDEDRGVGTAGHELGSHGLQYPAQSERLFKPEDLENIKLSRNVGKEYDTIGSSIPAFPGSYSSLSQQELELAQKKFSYYYNKPTEIAARAMGKGVSNAVAAGGESLAGVRDLDSYLSEFNRATKDSLAAAKHYDPEAYTAGLSKLALPLSLGGGAVAATSTPSRASDQVMSNVDIAGQGGSHETSQDTPRFNIPTGDPGKVMEDLGKVGKALMIPVNHAVEFFKETGQGMSEIGGALKGDDAARDYMATHEVTNPIGVMANVAGGSALSPGASLGKGAIQMQGFFSMLTKALESGVIGKSQLSAKMSGEQLLKTLQSAGIKEDELIFSGVGQKLSEIGKDRIGPTLFDELKNTAKEGALAFKRTDSPGVHSKYSLFSEGDPSFKNAVYTYPGVKFEEEHFGKGVVAHRRFGDKDIYDVESLPKLTADESSNLAAFRERNGYNPIWYDDMLKNTNIPVKNSLLLDEVQSQFYEQGSKFGHGEPKVPLATTEEGKLFYRATEHLMKGDNTSVKLFNSLKEAYPKIAEDAEKYYQHYLDASRADRSTPQGFAKGIQADANKEATFKRYLKPEDLSVDSAPLRGEKYVELLAKDHLRDALASGKDAISWTPSEVQHERYYGKDALGGVKWEFNSPDTHKKKVLTDILDANDVRPDYFKSFDEMKSFADGEYEKKFTGNFIEDQELRDLASAIRGSLMDLPDKFIPDIELNIGGENYNFTEVEQLNKNIGSVATKKLLEDMQNGATSGTLEGNAKEVYQKLYDRAIPKAFEKLTGEKPREGWVKGRNGEDVKINWVPLDKAKEKLMSTKDVRVSTLPDRIRAFNKKFDTTAKTWEDVLSIRDRDLSLNYKNIKRFIEELDRLPAKAKRSTVAVKPLPIAKADNVANDFFSGGVQQQAMPQGAYGMKDILNEVAWG